MLELLSPAGSPESLRAAVQSGADAVYLGYGAFNARRNAKNFNEEELVKAVEDCHLHGVKVYLTMNTLLTDRELPEAARTGAFASELGVDAVLVQDWGLAKLLRQTVPDLPLHASTQMTIHNLAGAELCAKLGMQRVVLSRELSRDAIAHICRHSPIEVEVFVHGALCMCYSGQCYLSSLIGGRSGNRGLCAQPCRLAYSWEKEKGFPLSLKDLSLAGHLKELCDMGVSCLKLEGRMKRPEYVSIVTKIYATALREGREPTAAELNQLEQAFSRQGFTQGYYLEKKNSSMFGTRTEGNPEALFASVRAGYESGEHRPIPITMAAHIQANHPIQLTAWDADGRESHAEGIIPEPALKRAMTEEQIQAQLMKTGGTAYTCTALETTLEEGLALPLSALNALRRDVLEGLTAQRTATPLRHVFAFEAAQQTSPRKKTPPVLTVSVRRAEQVTAALLERHPAVIYVPSDELFAHSAELSECMKRAPETELAVNLPRVVWDRELNRLREELSSARAIGVTHALVGNSGLIQIAREMGFALRGDFGLGIYNGLTLAELERLGFCSATVSFELKQAQIRDLDKPLDTEMLVYGRLPLMLMEHCIVKNRGKGCRCTEENQLRDRRGTAFPVVQAWGCRNELLNAKTLFLADKSYDQLGLWGARLAFTTESPEICVRVLDRYLGNDRYEPQDLTRGLYYRDVE